MTSSTKITQHFNLGMILRRTTKTEREDDSVILMGDIYNEDKDLYNFTIKIKLDDNKASITPFRMLKVLSKEVVKAC